MSTVGVFIVLLVAFIGLHRWYIRPRKKARRLELANRLRSQAQQQRASSPQSGLHGDGRDEDSTGAGNGDSSGSGGSGGGNGGSGDGD